MFLNYILIIINSIYAKKKKKQLREIGGGGGNRVSQSPPGPPLAYEYKCPKIVTKQPYLVFYLNKCFKKHFNCFAYKI